MFTHSATLVISQRWRIGRLITLHTHETHVWSLPSTGFISSRYYLVRSFPTTCRQVYIVLQSLIAASAWSPDLKFFERHRVPDLFTHREVAKLFKTLLILAVFDDSAYFMPCLQRLPTIELSKQRVGDSSPIAPLVIHFPRVHTVECSARSRSSSVLRQPFPRPMGAYKGGRGSRYSQVPLS